MTIYFTITYEHLTNILRTKTSLFFFCIKINVIFAAHIISLNVMSEIVKFSQVEEKILTIRGEKVILDSDIAQLYNVGTKEVNQAVKNNPDKFPQGYIFELGKEEFENLRSKFLTANMAKTRVLPKAFTEKGLYMLATILKSTQATQTTIAIVETFAKIRELARTVSEISETSEETQKKSLMQKSSEIVADLLGDELKTTETETSIEVDLILMKFKHTTKRK